MLENKDYLLCKEIADQALKLKDEEIQFHIKDHLKSFIGDSDMSNYDVRNKVFLFLQHISTVFLNYCLNSNMYFLSDAEIEKALIGRKAIVSIIKGIREQLN